MGATPHRNQNDDTRKTGCGYVRECFSGKVGGGSKGGERQNCEKLSGAIFSSTIVWLSGAIVGGAIAPRDRAAERFVVLRRPRGGADVGGRTHSDCY